MESKVVSLEVIPGHPKFLRLPSLSRSLIHSILPKTCKEMYLRPSIFSITTKPLPINGPPELSNQKRSNKKIRFISVSRPENIRPSTSSYTYKKVYQSKSPPKRIIKNYFTPKKLASPKQATTKLYYCEVTLLQKQKKHLKKFPRSLNTTNINFSEKSDQQDSLHKIPEVGSSMESSEYNVESVKSLKLF